MASSGLRLLAGLSLAAAVASTGSGEVECIEGYDDAGECLVSKKVENQLLQRNVKKHHFTAHPVRPEDEAHFMRNLPDYDCDYDGVRDCGNFDYEMGKCGNSDMCAHRYKWGDGTLDQSCRCRKCPITHGDAFGDEHFKDPAGSGAPFDALYWGNFKNWADHMDTCAPWIMPKDDDDLRQVLAYAKEHGYKVRVSGAGHSAGGIVTDGEDSNVVVVSLAEYTAPGEWEFGMTDMPDGSKRATVNAGWTQFHLYQKVRPLGFFVPAQTAGYFFSMGGVVGNSVHGGSYLAGFIHSYATRARVMLANGTITIIEEAEMKYWRNSFGLNGIMLGVEMQLEKRDHLQMYTVEEDMTSWDSKSFWKFIKQSSEANLPDSEVPADGGVGSKKSWNGEFFFDFVNNEMPIATCYAQKANSSVDADFADGTSTPSDIVSVYENLKAKRVAEDGKGWMSWGEAARRDGSPPIKILGVDVNDLLGGVKSFRGMAKIMSKAALGGTANYVKQMRRKTNDGFFLMYAPAALAAAYFVPAEKGFEAMDYLRKIQRESLNDKEFVWNLPGEFRFINVTDSAVLQPIPSGLWLNIQMMAFPDLAKNTQAWKRAFKKVEDYWLNELGARPHMGKLYGFEEKDGQVEPFSDAYTCTIYSDAQKKEFDDYRKVQDPEGLFASGLGMKFLAACA